MIGRLEYEDTLPEAVPGHNDNTVYAVFATKLQASLNSREFLFVLILNADRSSLIYPLIPKATRHLLDLQLRSISTLLEQKKYKENTKTFKSSTKAAINLLFGNLTIMETQTRTKEEREKRVFDEVHNLLENWTNTIDTSYAAIYRYDSDADQLIMTRSTVEHIEKKTNKSGIQPLVLNVSTKSDVVEKGLTFSVWNGSSRSIFSANVNSQGSRECIQWWDNAVGVCALGRYFAGAKIIDPSCSENIYGVLTLNGNKTPDSLNKELEVEWEILPLLEVLSEELGRQLGKIS